MNGIHGEREQMTKMAMPIKVTLLTALLLAGCAMETTITPPETKAQGARPPATETKAASTEEKAPPKATIPIPTSAATAAPKIAPPTSHPSSVNPEKLIGATGKDLIARFGQPNMTLDITLPGKAAAEGYLYYPKDGKGCIHTFVVLEKNNKVTDYFCR
ncbi:MAG: hypothetical protein HQL95_01015 [Magnetococcales bacterium]|nr:hypothetical protein [Magnetococcales bacterium]